MNGLLKTLIKPDWDDNSKRSEILYAANILQIGEFQLIQFAPSLPKTRSGKIMRRILRKIAANEHDQLGDTTTLADPSVVESLVENRKNK